MNDLIALSVLVLSVVMIIVSIILRLREARGTSGRELGVIIGHVAVGLSILSVAFFLLADLEFQRLPYSFIQEFEPEDGIIWELWLGLH